MNKKLTEYIYYIDL